MHLVSIKNIVCIYVLFLLNISNVYSQNQLNSHKKISIFFDTNKDIVTATNKSSIRSTIITIGSFNIKEIYISGHTDTDASDEYNALLSERRAENTSQFFRSQGVNENMIILESFGETKPLGETKAHNRRVEITFVYKIPNEYLENPRLLIVQCFDAKTKSPIQANYVNLKKDYNNIFGKANSNGFCRFITSAKESKYITFSHSGYLNSNLKISSEILSRNKDTIRLEVFLKPIRVVSKISFDHIYFYTDTYKFKPKASEDLEKLLEYLNKNSSVSIEIQGHMNFPTNRIATRTQRIYNQNLSHNRARAVYYYLIKHGIKSNRLTYKGLSNSKMPYPLPIDDLQADANKRVEVWTLELIK